MAKRRRIALIYQYNENWIGGTYYIENLIRALKTLPQKIQPKLFIFCNSVQEYEKVQQNTGYPHLMKLDYYPHLSLLKRAINKVAGSRRGHYLFKPYHRNIDLIFPTDIDFDFLPEAKKLYWIPDFQEHYLQQYFQPEELERRKKNQQKIIQNGKYLVLSSNAAKKDFNEIYPQAAIEQFVLPFAVSHNKLNCDADITGKYKIPKDFFICCNQIWKHKNHMLVIEAIALLKETNPEIFVVFTGKQDDYRDPDFFNQLNDFISLKGVQDKIAFLGFIERSDQLALMKKAVAVVQPSLFEGWSTVIEDAKSLKLPILASSIDVHKEQLEKYTNYELFDPGDARGLAGCVLNRLKTKSTTGYAYEQDVQNFANGFSSIVEYVITGN